jgi:hypothetical protein
MKRGTGRGKSAKDKGGGERKDERGDREKDMERREGVGTRRRER